MLRSKKSLKAATNLLNDNGAFKKLRRNNSRKNRVNLINYNEDELKGKVGFILDGEEYFVVNYSNTPINDQLNLSKVPNIEVGDGKVYTVKDKSNELFAVKKFTTPINPKRLEKSKIMAELLTKENPSYIMKISKFFSYDNNSQAAILFSLINGETLQDIILKNYMKFKNLKVEQIKCIISSLIFGGFELLKLGIIHGDLYARNIMIQNMDSKCPKSVIIDVDDKYTLETLTNDFKYELYIESENNIDYIFNPQDTDCHRISRSLKYQPHAMVMNLIRCEILLIICSYVKKKDCFDFNGYKESYDPLLKSIETESTSDESLRILAKSIAEDFDPFKHYSYKDGIRKVNEVLNGLLEKMNNSLYQEILFFQETNSKKQLQKFLKYYTEFGYFIDFDGPTTKDIIVEKDERLIGKVN